MRFARLRRIGTRWYLANRRVREHDPHHGDGAVEA